MDRCFELLVRLVLPIVYPFLPGAQRLSLLEECRGEEKGFFMQKILDLGQLIQGMPETYGQDGKGDDAIAYLHYFNSGSDWYITEKDMNGGINQAFGYAILNGDHQSAECGYISIAELTNFGVELDFHFTPCTLATIKAQNA